MNKKAIIMAAAITSTSIAPAMMNVANADVIKENSTAIQAKEAVIKALNEKYASNTDNGLGNTINPVKPFENSRYAVILQTTTDIGTMDGLRDLAGHPYETLDFARSIKQIRAEVDKVTKEKRDAEAKKLRKDVIEEITSRYYKALKIYIAAQEGKLKNYIITDVNEVSRIIEKVKSDSTSRIIIIDKGINNNSAWATTTNKRIVTSVEDAESEVAISTLRNDFIELSKKTITPIKAVSEIENMAFTITLKSNKEIKIKVGDPALDVTKAILKDGTELKDISANTESVMKNVDKFAIIPNKDNKNVTFDVPTGDTKIYTLLDMEISQKNLGTIYSKETGYTKEGMAFVNSIIKAKRDNKASYSFNYDGVNYQLANYKNKPVTNDVDAQSAVHTESATIKAVDNGYQMSLDIDVVDKNDLDHYRTIRFVFEGKTQADLARVLKDIIGEVEVVMGHFEKLAGANRYETAIEISKNAFPYQSAETVVITGGNALIDGLSAAPLASAKNAPMLLSDKNGLSANTIAEIKRACKDLNRKTVYIVGGENSVPANVEKQLKDEFGAVVIRLAGANRYSTSLNVAKRLVNDKQTKSYLFVTGGEGAPDAMSIAPIASTKINNAVSPILVVNKDGISQSTRTYIKDNGFKESYLIGGENTVSTTVYKDLMNIGSVERIAGPTRYQTNLAIIKKFDPGFRTLFVASGKTKYLVDAQTAGAVASAKGASIMLTDSALSKEQSDLLKDRNLTVNVYQAGGIVSPTVMSEIVKILDL